MSQEGERLAKGNVKTSLALQCKVQITIPAMEAFVKNRRWEGSMEGFQKFHRNINAIYIQIPVPRF